MQGGWRARDIAWILFCEKKKKKFVRTKQFIAGQGVEQTLLGFILWKKKKKPSEQNNYCWKHSSLGQVQKDLQATDICLGVFFCFFFLFVFKNLRERKELLLDHSSSGQVQKDLQATDMCSWVWVGSEQAQKDSLQKQSDGFTDIHGHRTLKAPHPV